MSVSPITTVDYREAFVLDMEMAAHGPNCKQCVLAALHGVEENFCYRMQYMRAYIKRAYEILPAYYKQRYEQATNMALANALGETQVLHG